MIILTIIAIVMGIISMVAWIIEGKEFTDAIQRIKCNTISEKLMYGTRFLLCIPLLFPLIIDFGVTIGITKLFGMTGFLGTVMGLSMSNILSGYIIWKTKKGAKYATA